MPPPHFFPILACTRGGIIVGFYGIHVHVMTFAKRFKMQLNEISHAG